MRFSIAFSSRIRFRGSWPSARYPRGYYLLPPASPRLDSVDIPEVARQVIAQIGYEHTDFNARDCTVMTSLMELPSPPYPNLDEREMDEEEIDAVTAKNQGNVFGFACNQTAALMPLQSGFRTSWRVDWARRVSRNS